MLRNCANLKAIRYESTSLSRVVADKSHRVIVALATRYSLLNHKISGELKSCDSFWMYPPLWTSLLAAMQDDIENESIMAEFQTLNCC